jgi:hypothetical protein
MSKSREFVFCVSLIQSCLIALAVHTRRERPHYLTATAGNKVSNKV